MSFPSTDVLPTADRTRSVAVPKFSLVVPTVGRPIQLRALLQSLADQTFHDFEVLVIDQSPTDESAAVIAEFDKLQIRHDRMRDRRGASRARNRGIELATGDIIGFPDDDCTLPPDFLASLAERFTAASGLDGVATQALHVNRFDQQSGPINRRNAFHRFCEPTMYIRRDRLGNHRFNEQMGPGAGTAWGADEGADLLLRLLEHGSRWHYFHDLVVWHPDPKATIDERTFQRAFSYAYGRGYVLRRFRYSPWTVGRYIARSFAGSLVMLCRGDWSRARFYWNAFAGQLCGFFSPGPKEA
jgi:glycosyltransferase involved in cell wall biosynthesis